MTAATLPRIVRFTASRDNDCGSPWACGGVKAGERCAYVGGGAGTTPFCGPCADRVEAGEHHGPAVEPVEQPAPAGDEQPPAAAPEQPAAGELPTGETCECPDVPTDVDTCDCASMQGAGFTKAGELWVHAACSRPTAQYLAARTAGEAAPTEPEQPAKPAKWGEGTGAMRIPRKVAERIAARRAAEAETSSSSDAATSDDEQPAAAGDLVPHAVAAALGDEQRRLDEAAERVANLPITEGGTVRVVEQPAQPRSIRDVIADEVDEWIAGGTTPSEQQQVEQAAADGAAARLASGPQPADQPALAPETPAAGAEPGSDDQGAGDEPMPLPDLSPYMADATSWGADPETTAAEIVDAIRRGILAGDLRGRQVELGPSEVGHECARWLAYRLAGVPATGTEPVPWRQRIGTLVHDDVDGHLHLDNAERQTRWLTGLRVNVGELYPGRPIEGTLDVFDLVSGAVVDLKVPGTTAMRNYGPGKPEREQYRKQVQLYGRGVMRAGYLPAWVSVLRLSPARELSEYVFKFEPFNAAVAEQALARAGGIARMVDQLGARAAELVPPTEATCHRCPWFRPNSPDLTTGCPGAPGASLGRLRRASVDDLVA
jgi:hypothetical protein